MDQKPTKFDILNSKLDSISQRQDDLTKLITSLIQKNAGVIEVNQILFPIESRHNLKRLENELKTKKRMDIIVVMKRLLNGKLRNLNQILAERLIKNHNYYGLQGKYPLIKYEHFLKALYEATKTEGMSFDWFIAELRLTLRRLKNAIHSANARQEIKLNNRLSSANKENEKE